MSKFGRGAKPEVTHELIENVMARAHRERNEAIRQLFGFGFTVVKNTVRSTLQRRDRAPGKTAAAARG